MVDKTVKKEGIAGNGVGAKHHMRVIIALSMICTLFAICAIMLTVYTLGETMMAFWISLAIVALYVVALTLALYIETQLGYYVCRNCGKKFVPKFLAVYFAMHIGWIRHLRCPKCHQKNMVQKVWE